MLIGTALSHNLYVAYLLFILYHSSFEFMAPIVSAQIALSMPTYRYGLIFSINVMAAMLFQTIIQVIVSQLELAIRVQFIFFGCCLFGISFVYSLILLFSFVRNRITKIPVLYRPI